MPANCASSVDSNQVVYLAAPVMTQQHSTLLCCCHSRGAVQLTQFCENQQEEALLCRSGLALRRDVLQDESTPADLIHAGVGCCSWTIMV